MIEALVALGSAVAELQSLAEATPPGGEAAIAGASFAGALKQALGRLDRSIASADAAAKSFAAGNRDIPLSDVMLSLEQANLALQLAANVRDKVAAAYTSIMNMQL